MANYSYTFEGQFREDMCCRPQALSKTNPALAKAEREFLAGKRYTDIKIRIVRNGGTYDSPVKPKPCKTL